MVTPFTLPPTRQGSGPLWVLTAPPTPRRAYTVKVPLLAAGPGDEVAGFHTGPDGRGGLLQAATQVLAPPWLRAFL